MDAITDFIPGRSAPTFVAPNVNYEGEPLPDMGEEDRSDEAAMLRELDEVFQEAVAYTEKSNIPAKRELCEALFHGRHHLEWDAKNGVIRENQIVKNHGMVVNLVRAQWRIARAKIYGGRRRLEAIPVIGTEQGRKAARLATQLIESWDEEHKTDQRNLVMAGLLLIYGKAFVRVFWDSSAVTTLGLKVPSPDFPAQSVSDGEYLGRVPNNGVWVDAYRGRYGNIAEEIRMPHDVYVEPGIPSLDQAHRFFVATLRTIGWIKQNFGEEMASRIKPDEIADIHSPSGERYSASFFNEGDSDTLESSRFTSDAQLVWVKECWRATNTGRWERILYVQGSNNTEGVWLNPDEPAWPHHGWIEFSLVERPDTFWPDAPIWDWKDLQYEINLLHTLAKINTKHARKSVLVTDGEIEFEDRDAFYVFKRTPGPNAGQVAFDRVPMLAPEFLRMADELYTRMQRVSLVNEISHAMPSGVTSGTGIEKLREEEMVVPNSFRRFLEDGNARVAKVKLEFARHFYTEPYLVGNVGKNGDSELITGDALPAVVKIAMVESSVLPEGRQARTDAALQMFQMGLFDPGREDAARRMMQFVQATSSDFDTLFPAGARNEGVVQKWIEKIMAGTIIVTQTPPSPTPQNANPVSVLDALTGRPLVFDWMNHTEILADMTERILMGDLDSWSPEQLAIYDAIMQALAFYQSQQMQMQQSMMLAAKGAPRMQDMQQAPTPNEGA